MFSLLTRQLSKVRTPSILQVEHTECGVVSLAIIFGFYKKWFSIEYLREACGVSRDGSNAMNLIKFARNHGFDASGYSLEMEDLKELNSFPMIIHWKFNHFVVVEKIKGKKYWINDPAAGRVILDEKEVDECFTGVVLNF
jgi:ABC-type bacteriocin/lantibiotic exporter with double-glycine peptidase domain